jgi:HAD superfamily hydrolase (TIGR01456 family)
MVRSISRLPFEATVRHLRTHAVNAGFVFDIDGVFLRGSRVLDAGVRAMKLLYDSSNERWHAPVAFLTNGGGMSEEARANNLTSMLGVPINPSQVVLAHTPLRSFVSKLARPGHSVVTVGGPACPDVARAYGFERVLDIAQFGQARPESTPFACYDIVARLSDADAATALLPVCAALVMTDSREFQRDMQLLVDIVESGHARGKSGLASICYCNPDVTFPSAIDGQSPRLAGGMMRIAVDGALAAMHGKGINSFGSEVASPPFYHAMQLGKPYAPNFRCAERMLLRQVPEYDGESDASSVLGRIYMVGDNPLSDIAGANARGGSWNSILLRSGVYQGGPHDADALFDDVYEAVLRTKTW